MKITRRIDELGRVVLPADLRSRLNLAEKDAVDIKQEGESIVITKAQRTCNACGATENLHSIGRAMICEACKRKLIARAIG